jgi:hypothetical protein
MKLLYKVLGEVQLYSILDGITKIVSMCGAGLPLKEAILSVRKRSSGMVWDRRKRVAKNRQMTRKTRDNMVLQYCLTLFIYLKGIKVYLFLNNFQ